MIAAESSCLPAVQNPGRDAGCLSSPMLHAMQVMPKRSHLDGARVLVGDMNGVRLRVRNQLPHPSETVPAALRRLQRDWAS